MTINPLSNVSQMLLSGINKLTAGAGSTTSTNTTAPGDSSQLSPFAQLMQTLQQLQQTNPTQYKQVTATISSDLQAAASNAQANGNSGEANALSQLAASFSQASQSGQLPSFMQQSTPGAGALGHGHHHHHSGGGGLGQDLNSISQTILSNLDPSSSGASAGGNASTPQ